MTSRPQPPATTQTTARKDLFLTFASKDRELARAAYRQLTAWGKRVWFEEEHAIAGRDIKQMLKAAVHSCDAILALIGDADDAPFQAEEIKAAVVNRATVIPLYLKEADFGVVRQRWSWAARDWSHLQMKDGVTAEGLLEEDATLVLYAGAFGVGREEARAALARHAAGTGASDDTASRPAADEPRSRALLIGIESYANFTHVGSAPSDVEGMGRALEGLGWTVERCLGTDGVVTYDDLFESLKGVVNRSAPADRLLVYFSGHGAKANGGPALCPSNGEASGEYLYPLAQLAARLAGRRTNDGIAGPTVVFLDCCHSKPTELELDMTARDGLAWFGAATGPTDKAESGRMSRFTTAVVDALHAAGSTFTTGDLRTVLGTAFPQRDGLDTSIDLVVTRSGRPPVIAQRKVPTFRLRRAGGWTLHGFDDASSLLAECPADGPACTEALDLFDIVDGLYTACGEIPASTFGQLRHLAERKLVDELRDWLPLLSAQLGTLPPPQDDLPVLFDIEVDFGSTTPASTALPWEHALEAAVRQTPDLWPRSVDHRQTRRVVSAVGQKSVAVAADTVAVFCGRHEPEHLVTLGSGVPVPTLYEPHATVDSLRELTTTPCSVVVLRTPLRLVGTSVQLELFGNDAGTCEAVAATLAKAKPSLVVLETIARNTGEKAWLATVTAAMELSGALGVPVAGLCYPPHVLGELASLKGDRQAGFAARLLAELSATQGVDVTAAALAAHRKLAEVMRGGELKVPRPVVVEPREA